MQRLREPAAARAADCGCETCKSPAPRARGCAGNQQMQHALRVGDAGDAHEVEADRVAHALTRMPDGRPAPPTPPPTPPTISRAGGPAIARKSHLGALRHGGEITPSTLAAATGQGRPLDHETRGYFEPRLGRGLQDVRVHTGAAADRLAQRIDAAAFTFGRDIVFADGHYRPDTPGGRRLLAHELTHTLQQQGGPRFIQRNDKAAAQALAQLSQLDEKAAPKAGADAKTFVLVAGRVIVLSSDRAHVRRSVAKFIGATSIAETESAVALVEQQGERSGGKEKAMAQLMREQFGELKAAWTKFSADTRNAAIVRLKINHKAMGEWRDYVGSLAPASVMNQTLAAQELKFLKSLSDKADPQTQRGPYVGPYDMKELGEMRAWSPSPGRRRWVEALNNDEIHGGCQDCHTQKSIPDYDSSFSADDPARIPPVFRMMGAADQETQAPPGLNPRVLDKPVQGQGPSDAMWSYVQGQPGMTSIADSTQRIATKIMPLIEQYKVVPISVINRPFTPQTLVAAILALIDQRREGYVELQGKVAAEDYDFLQLLPIVDAFIGSVDADVRVMIRSAQESSAAAQAAKQTGLTLLGILAMLLTIFPPTAPLGIVLGVGVAAAGVAQGYQDYQQGLQYMQGTGAEVFSPEQEAAAGMLMASGMMSMALNAFSLTMVGVGAGRALANAMAKPPPGGFSYSWTPVSFDKTSGVMTAVGKNLTAGSAGEMATIRINVRTGMGTATLHGPKGMTVPVVNGKMQFSAGLLPESASGAGGAMVNVSPASGAGGTAMTPAAPGTLSLPAGQGPSFIRGYLAVGDAASAVTSAARPHYGSKIILPSDAPEPGQAPVYVQKLAGEPGSEGVRLMNRGLRPSDFGNNGYRGNMIADDATHLDLWTQAEAKVARSARDNIYKRWLAAVKDGSVVNWSNDELHNVYKSLWDEYKELARAQGIDVATLHHWNYNKSLYPYQVVDPRNLMPVYGQAQLRGGDHPMHQGGLHPQTTSGHPTRDPIDPINEQPLDNYDVPAPNPDYPGMPDWWHPPMLPPEEMVPFGWDPFYPPKWPNWPGGKPPVRPPR